VPLCVRFDDLTPAPINSELVARSWDFGNAITDTVQSREFCYYLAGRNDVTLSLLTDKGCKRVLKREGLIEAFGLPDPDFRFGAASSDILKPSVEIENLTVNATSFTWNFGDGSPLLQTFSPVHEFPDTGTYFVKLYAENDQGCIDSIIKMYVVDPFYTFYIPNSFTPNGDGKNDFFTIKGQFIDTYDIQIFDRWGRVIFSQVNTEGVRWDANQVPDGVYIYSIKVSDVGGKEHKYKGTLSVIR
jgi:gliding motility-associated-like protein